MARWAAYCYKEGLEVFQYKRGRWVKKASGDPAGLKPIHGFLGKKILVIGRELLFHTRKRFPPAPMKKLIKAVGLEIGEIFPISNPLFHCRLNGSSTAYTILDIWAWEKELSDGLKKVFNYDYIIPEDLIYSQETSEVKVIQSHEMTHLIAHTGPKFLGSVSYPELNLDEQKMERFLSSMGRDRSEIKRIVIHGSMPFQLKGTDIPELVRAPERDYPPCLEDLERLNLKEFKVKRKDILPSQIGVLYRIPIYLILGYGIVLYVMGHYYGQTVNEIRQKIIALDSKVNLKNIGKDVEDYSDIVEEVSGRLSLRHSPLKTMDKIARHLPAGSFITRMVLNENNLEVSVSSKEPLSVIKSLGGVEGIKTAKLKGAPMKELGTDSFKFVVIMELTR